MRYSRRRWSATLTGGIASASNSRDVVRSDQLTGRRTMATAKKASKKAAKKPAAKKPAAKKSAKKAPAKKAPAKKAPAKKAAHKKTGAKRKPNAAFMKAMTPSSTLGAV